MYLWYVPEPKLHVALFDYTAQHDDEVALQKGTLFGVTEFCRDG